MLLKYSGQVNNIFEYIRNRTSIDIPVEDITKEVIERYSPEILFPSVDNETLHDFVCVLVKYAYFMYHNKAYDR